MVRVKNKKRASNGLPRSISFRSNTKVKPVKEVLEVTEAAEPVATATADTATAVVPADSVETAVTTEDPEATTPPLATDTKFKFNLNQKVWGEHQNPKNLSTIYYSPVVIEHFRSQKLNSSASFTLRIFSTSDSSVIHQSYQSTPYVFSQLKIGFYLQEKYSFTSILSPTLNI